MSPAKQHFENIKQLVENNTDLKGFSTYQTNEDDTNRQYCEDFFPNTPFLTSYEKELILEQFTKTMEKYRIIHNFLVNVFTEGYLPGYPKNIYGINLSDGTLDTDKSGRRISYGPEVLIPSSSTAVQFIDAKCGKVYAIFPPIKSAERTMEKIVDERIRELKQYREEQLKKATSSALKIDNEDTIISFNIPKDGGPVALNQTIKKPLIAKKADETHHTIAKKFISKVAKEDILPKDIYRLSILAKHRSHLEHLIKKFKQKLPNHIKFEDDENNLYKQLVSQRKRGYIDIKCHMRITIPETNFSFYVEIQFKQTNQFYAHIRSHRAYEDYRILDAKYKKQKESAERKRTLNDPKVKADLAALAKKRDEKLALCEKIHKSALHQSNFYVMQEIAWMDECARAMEPEGHNPNANGQYEASVQFLKDNYTVENYEPFDGLTAFATNEKEHLNKSYFLKLIGKLPESFDELGKNAPEQIKKVWNTLEVGDINKFKNITNTAIRYQNPIRALQKERQAEEKQDGTIQQKLLEQVMISAQQNVS